MLVYISRHAFDQRRQFCPALGEGQICPLCGSNATHSYCRHGKKPDLWDKYSRSCPRCHIPTHSDKQEKPWIKHLLPNIGIRIHIISWCKFAFNLCYLVDMQQTLSKLSVYTNMINNQDAMWGNHWPVGLHCMFTVPKIVFLSVLILLSLLS